MATELALQLAAQAWCTPETGSREMDTVLAVAFANIIDNIWSTDSVHNSTTAELIEELFERVKLGYI